MWFLILVACWLVWPQSVHCQRPEEFLNILDRITSSKVNYFTFLIIFQTFVKSVLQQRLIWGIWHRNNAPVQCLYLDLWLLRRFFELQNLLHCWQWYPELPTCFTSMWFFILVVCGLVWSQSVHCHIPEEFLNILDRNTSSKVKYWTFIINIFICVKRKIGYIFKMLQISVCIWFCDY